MKKYKHKQTGNIAIEILFKNTYKLNIPENFTIPKWIIENSNDWEEIKELDFLIVEKEYIPGHRCSGTPELMWDVKSVVRTSDNVVFKVGDITNNGTISKMFWVADTIRVYFKDKSKNYHVNLNTIEHSKVLFITEDDIDVKEGDKIYFVYNHNNFYIGEPYVELNKGKAFTIYDDIASPLKENEEWSSECKYFSTKEKAQEYIDLNKPRYSKQDILNITEQLKTHTPAYWNIILTNVL